MAQIEADEDARSRNTGQVEAERKKLITAKEKEK